MIIETQGENMFRGPARAKICPVNMIGAMGSGLALYFKKMDPPIFKFYQRACRENMFAKFNSILYRGECGDVILFPTKIHWMNPSKLSWIDRGLGELKKLCAQEGIEELSMPAIGCGLGELTWEDVRFLIYHHFENSPVRVYLYSPH